MYLTSIISIFHSDSIHGARWLNGEVKEKKKKKAKRLVVDAFVPSINISPLFFQREIGGILRTFEFIIFHSERSRGVEN